MHSLFLGRFGISWWRSRHMLILDYVRSEPYYGYSITLSRRSFTHGKI